MSAIRTTRIEVTEDELALLVCGHIRDTYGLVVEPKNIEITEGGTAVATRTEDIAPKMSRDMRPPSTK